MKQFWFKLGATLFVGFAVLIGMIVVLSGDGKERVSPTAVRPWGKTDWDGHLTPSPTPPPADTALIDSIEPEISVDEVKFEYASRPYTGGNFAERVIDQTKPESLDPNGPRIDMRCIGVAWLDDLTEEEKAKRNAGYFSKSTDIRLFHPDGRPLSEEETKEVFPGPRQRSRQLRSHNAVPNVAHLDFHFDIDGLDSPRVASGRLFDARTLAPVSSGGSWTNSRANPHHWGARVALWRSTPLVLVLDVEHGPVKTAEIDHRVGEKFRFGTVECRLVAAVEGESTGYSSSSGSDPSGVSRIKATIRLSPGSKEKSSLFVFAISPRSLSSHVDFEALGPSDETMSSNGGGGAGNIRSVGFRAPLDQVARLRATFRPHLTRFLVPLPGIPGMPEENRDAKNLLDVKIPYACVKDFNELATLLTEMTELKRVNLYMGSSAATRSSFFPKEYRNATARELLEDLRAENAMGAEGRIRLDTEDWELVKENANRAGIVSRIAKSIEEFLRRVF